MFSSSKIKFTIVLLWFRNIFENALRRCSNETIVKCSSPCRLSTELNEISCKILHFGKFFCEYCRHCSCKQAAWPASKLEHGNESGSPLRGVTRMPLRVRLTHRKVPRVHWEAGKVNKPRFNAWNTHWCGCHKLRWETLHVAADTVRPVIGAGGHFKILA